MKKKQVKPNKTDKKSTRRASKKPATISIRDYIADRFPDVLLMDGYDDCIAGIVTRFGQDPIVCYDRGKVLQRHINDGMTYEEAVEYFEFNQIGGWVGDMTPCFISTFDPNRLDNDLE